jgi:hypothetical protein
VGIVPKVKVHIEGDVANGDVGVETQCRVIDVGLNLFTTGREYNNMLLKSSPPLIAKLQVELESARASAKTTDGYLKRKNEWSKVRGQEKSGNVCV